MADNVSGLPARGQTYHGPNKTLGTGQNTYGITVGLEGTTKSFDDLDPASGSPGPKTKRSGATQTCILVRNTSGVTLYRRRIVTWETGYQGRRVNGYCKAKAESGIAGVVDEHLSTNGVRDEDLFWMQVKGPCLVKSTHVTADAETSVNIKVHSAVAGSPTATTAGSFEPFALSSNVTYAFSATMNAIGRAISAVSAASTNKDALIDLHIM